MTLQSEDRQILIKRELDKARETMEEADFCASGGKWNLVGNRLYYSIFHGVIALLIHKELSVTSHKGASRMFALNYVRTGEFSAEDHLLYSRLQTIREKADYQNVYKINPEEGQEYLILAKNLLNKIETYLFDIHGNVPTGF